MLKDLPKEEFGQHIDFREYSFLENPSLPKEVILSNCFFIYISH
jgi:arabinosyltransferase